MPRPPAAAVLPNTSVFNALSQQSLMHVCFLLPPGAATAALVNMLRNAAVLRSSWTEK